MNNFIYEKLAVTNLKNNRKTYVPYIFTGVLTVMMFYIIDALSRGKGITQDTLKICLQYATGVIVVFAVIFLFYTNSFLIKRRKKEIGCIKINFFRWIWKNVLTINQYRNILQPKIVTHRCKYKKERGTWQIQR